MNDMKCPFCKEEIISDLCLMFDKKDKDYTNGRQIYKCNKCGLFGNKKLVQELIRTRKALGVAVDALKSAKARLELINNSKFANLNNVLQIQCQCEVLKINEALEQITALKQKETKCQ